MVGDKPPLAPLLIMRQFLPPPPTPFQFWDTLSVPPSHLPLSPCFSGLRDSLPPETIWAPPPPPPPQRTLAFWLFLLFPSRDSPAAKENKREESPSRDSPAAKENKQEESPSRDSPAAKENKQEESPSRDSPAAKENKQEESPSRDSPAAKENKQEESPSRDSPAAKENKQEESQQVAIVSSVGLFQPVVMFVLFVRRAGHVNIQQGWACGHVSTLFMTEALLGCQFCSSF